MRGSDNGGKRKFVQWENGKAFGNGLMKKVLMKGEAGIITKSGFKSIFKKK
jgi:hypothetical protein